jgi:osmoprotectant transport system ATP-binding protein
MIQFQGIVKTYGSIRAVDGVDLEIRTGELCVLVGTSGCGKSTLLRTVNRMVEPDQGEVRIDGQPVREHPAEDLRRTMGYVIQSVGLFPHMTVGENIAVVPRLLGMSSREVTSRVSEMLDLVGLSVGWAGRWPRELSGGEAQRVGVARALAADPPILLMDEPFGSVDPLTRVRLQREFLSIQRRLHKTVLFVTHDVEEAIRLADRIAVMRSGRILRYATPEQFIASDADGFVAEFLGLEYGVEILSRKAVQDAMESFGAVPETQDRQVEDSADPSAPVIRQDASLKEALGLMAAFRVECLTVTDGKGNRVGTLRLGDVLGTMRSCP